MSSSVHTVFPKPLVLAPGFDGRNEYVTTLLQQWFVATKAIPPEGTPGPRIYCVCKDEVLSLVQSRLAPLLGQTGWNDMTGQVLGGLVKTTFKVETSRTFQRAPLSIFGGGQVVGEPNERFYVYSNLRLRTRDDPMRSTTIDKPAEDWRLSEYVTLPMDEEMDAHMDAVSKGTSDTMPLDSTQAEVDMAYAFLPQPDLGPSFATLLEPSSFTADDAYDSGTVVTTSRNVFTAREPVARRPISRMWLHPGLSPEQARTGLLDPRCSWVHRASWTPMLT